MTDKPLASRLLGKQLGRWTVVDKRQKDDVDNSGYWLRSTQRFFAQGFAFLILCTAGGILSLLAIERPSQVMIPFSSVGILAAWHFGFYHGRRIYLADVDRLNRLLSEMLNAPA